MIVDPQDLREAFAEAKADMQAALKEHFEAGKAVADAQQFLDTRKARLAADGLEGKNQAERDANLKLACNAEINTLKDATERLNAAKLDLDQARIVWDYCRYMLRLLEVSSKEVA